MRVRSPLLVCPLTLLLTNCANVVCPPDQVLRDGLCLCSSTLEPPIDGGCIADDICDPDGCSCTLEGIEAAIARGGMQMLKCEDGASPVTPRQTIVIDNDVSLDGRGNLTVQGDNRTLLFQVQAFDVQLIGMTITRGDQGLHVVPNATVTLTNATVSENTSTVAPGGGIRNEGTLTLVDTTVEGNVAVLGSGGGIYNAQGAALTLEDTRVRDNEVTAGAGGGIGSDEGTVVLNGSEVSGNKTGADTTLDGGGISSIGGALVVSDCIIRGNEASDRGGGISVVSGTAEIAGTDFFENRSRIGGGFRGTDASVTVTRSSWLRNTARRFGGGVFISGPDAEFVLRDSTVSENTTDPSGGVFDDGGGGIGADNSASVAIINSTIHANSADSGNGGDLYISDTGSTMVVRSSTISSNAETGITNNASLTLTQTIIESGCDLGEGATVTSSGNNIESPGDTCGLDQGTDRVGVTPNALDLAQQLEDNGGDTLTLLPGDLSVAVDYFFGVCDQPTDQRGIARPQGNGCDIGAVELQ
jgi:fibronectin-binding autotransporter adhesin